MPNSITTAKGAATPPNADEDEKNKQSRKFPLELRDLIWEQCLPHRTRIIFLENEHGNGDPPRTYPVIAQVCREARRVVSLHGSWKTVTNCLDSPRRTVRCWYSKKTDLIYLERVMDALKGAAKGSDGNDLARLVVQEPDTPLLIASCIMPLISGWYFDNIKMRKRERKTALYNLYNKLLKTRAHCFLELYRVEVILDDDSFQEAHRGGLFGVGRDKPEAVINADDTGALEKYMD